MKHVTGHNVTQKDHNWRRSSRSNAGSNAAPFAITYLLGISAWTASNYGGGVISHLPMELEMSPVMGACLHMLPHQEMQPTQTHVYGTLSEQSIGDNRSAKSFLAKSFSDPGTSPPKSRGHPGHSLSKTTEKGALHKVFVQDIPTSGSLMSQEYPAQNLCL